MPTLHPSLDWEKKLGYPASLIAGVDEVGRGCLAGPVVAAAVLLPSINTGFKNAPVHSGIHPRGAYQALLKPNTGFKNAPTHPDGASSSDLFDYYGEENASWLSTITDSKALTATVRENLVPKIEAWAGAYAIGFATVEEIDRINIYHASHLAMVRAVQGLRTAPEHLLVDGNVVPKALAGASTPVVKGDLKCLSIAAASILAKVWRDRLMTELDEKYPGYGFAGHKGYATPVHSAALKKLGACEIHRRSFAPVAAVVQPQLL